MYNKNYTSFVNPCQLMTSNKKLNIKITEENYTWASCIDLLLGI